VADPVDLGLEEEVGVPRMIMQVRVVQVGLVDLVELVV